MGRINVAADEQIVRELEQEAKRRGFTMFSVTNFALRTALKVMKEGEDLQLMESLLEFYKIAKGINLVPITAWYLDNISVRAYQKDREGFEQICEGAGEQLASYLKGRVRDLSSLLNLYEVLKPALPINEVVIREKDGLFEIQVSGSGFSKESTTCAGKVLSKVVEAYGLKVFDMTASPGGIITAKARINQSH
jgi:hypothetical protein